MKLGIKLCRQGAQLPTYATPGSACFDLHAVMDFSVELYSGMSLLVPTGLIFDIPEGHVMMVYSRSGQGFKHDVRLANCVGVIDSDYKSEVMVKLRRDGNNWIDPFVVEHGDRIAQAMIVPVQQFTLEQVEEITETGRGGFGSTGK